MSPAANPMRPARGLRRIRDERGAVAVMVALLLVVLVGSAAVALDLARLAHERHIVQSAVDLGSLAGSGFMPVGDAGAAAVAEGVAREVTANNAPGLDSLNVTFHCVVSDPDGDGNGDNSPDIDTACGPGTGPWVGSWIQGGARVMHECYPGDGNLCNTIRVAATNSIDYFFAPILGFQTGNTGSLNATACRGICGLAASPLDVVFVIDRTRSMSDQDILNVQAAIANTSPEIDSVLEYYDPSQQQVGLVALPYADPGNECAVSTAQDYPNFNWSLWQLVGETGLSNDYNSNGVLNLGSEMVSRTLCLAAPQVPLNVTVDGNPVGGGHTNHGDPIDAAQIMVANQGRGGVQDVIVFFADGESNQPNGYNPCQYAWQAATDAKSSGTIVFSLGYGVGNKMCEQDGFGSQFAGARADTFLAAAASPDFTTGAPSLADNSCVDPDGTGPALAPENDPTIDTDNYFCETRGADLEDVFRQITIATIRRSRLLNF